MDGKERPDADVTGLLQAWRGRNIDARDRLATVVYEELRRRARAYLRRERVGHTLQPTALVNEVFLLLVQQDRTAWQNRAQFFGVASQMMRRLLVDRFGEKGFDYAADRRADLPVWKSARRAILVGRATRLRAEVEAAGTVVAAELPDPPRGAATFLSAIRARQWVKNRRRS